MFPDLPSLSWKVTILGYVGYLCGIFISRWIDPDSDLMGMTESEGRLMNEWRITKFRFIQELGGAFGFLIVWWMLPYAYIMRFFGGHRGLSHVYVLGTLTRVLWLLVPIALVWWWYYWSYPEFVTPWLIGVFIGLSIMDSLHVWLDNHPPRRLR